MTSLSPGFVGRRSNSEPLLQRAPNATIFRGFCKFRFYQRTPGCQPDPRGNDICKPLFYNASPTTRPSLWNAAGDRGSHGNARILPASCTRNDAPTLHKRGETCTEAAANVCSSIRGTAAFCLQCRTLNTRRAALQLHCKACRSPPGRGNKLRTLRQNRGVLRGVRRILRNRERCGESGRGDQIDDRDALGNLEHERRGRRVQIDTRIRKRDHGLVAKQIDEAGAQDLAGFALRPQSE